MSRAPALASNLRVAIAEGARAEIARRSLFEFMRQGWHVLEPGVEPEWNWHIEALCLQVQAMGEAWLVANGHGTPAMRRRVVASWATHGLTYREGSLLVQNLLVNMPPGTLKSRILMVFFPAWMWLHCPSWSVAAISSVDDNVKRDSNAHRDLVESPWYRETFAIQWKIRSNVDSVGEWVTTAGGERKSRTLLGAFTGVHVDCILLDDPDDAHKVHNEPARRDVQGKWTRAIRNRIKHAMRSIRIAIQQRVHVDDWTAAQIQKGLWSPQDRKAWAWVVMPLLYGRGPAEAPGASPWGWMDPRRVANDNLHPARFSDEEIADEIRERGPEGFEGQYNQNPQPLDGGLIKRADVKFFRIQDEPVTTRKRPLGCGLLAGSDGAEEEAYVVAKLPSGELDVDWLTVTIDCSNGSEAVTASSNGILVVAGKGMRRFVLDDLTDIMSIQGMYDTVAAVIGRWHVGKAIIELKAAGSSVINELKKRLAEGDLRWPNGQRAIVEVVAYNPGKDSKESRAAAMAPAWRAGLVYVLDGAEWLFAKVIAGGRVVDPGFIGEVCSYPKSKRNDRIDAIGQLIAYYRDAPVPQRVYSGALVARG